MIKKILWIVTMFSVVIGYSSLITYAGGWEKAGTSWAYREDDNQLVRNDWRKGVDDKWRWLDENGIMAVNSWVNAGRSYVMSDGIRVESSWLSLTIGENVDWYYFDTYGNKVTSTWKKANDKWFYLGDEGKVLKGWLENNTYYCDEKGVMAVGWHKLTPPNQQQQSISNHTITDGQVWYYFGSNGKKYMANIEAGVEEKKIDGVTYCFDSTGAMLVGWVNIKGSPVNVASIQDFRYFNEDGSQRTGWYSLKPPLRIMENYENDVEWFYFDQTGVPRSSGEGLLKTSNFTKINGRTYLFGRNGVPIYGLQRIYTSNENYDIYYFGSNTQRNIQKGKFMVTEPNGMVSEYYFDTMGRGYTGVDDDKLYYKGKLQVSYIDGKYRIISIPSSEGYQSYAVNRNGKIVRDAHMKDVNNVEYKTDSAGIVIQYGGNAIGLGAKFDSPQEAEIH